MSGSSEKNILNPFDGIYERINRISASAGPLPEYPLLIDMEVTSRCNLRCVMCEHTYMRRGQQDMDQAIFRSVIDQSAKYGPGIRFIMFSEPFLLGDIIERCRYVKSAGLLLHITTNGTVVDHSHIDDLIEAGVDSITFSFQGADREEYVFIRRPGDGYGKLVDNIRYTKEKRDLDKKRKPFIQVSTTITQRDKPENIELFKKEWGKIADRVTVGLTSWSRIAEYRPDIYEFMGIKSDQGRRKYTPCQDIFTKVAILANGNITVCCDDAEGRLTVGNIRSDKIKDVWDSEVYGGMRKILKNMRMDMLDLCKNCYPAYDFRKKDGV